MQETIFYPVTAGMGGTCQSSGIIGSSCSIHDTQVFPPGEAWFLRRGKNCCTLEGTLL